MSELIEKGDFQSLRVERQGDLLWVSLDEPERANAFSPGMVAEITRLYGMDLRAVGIRAMLLGAAGKHFSAGADLAHLKSLGDAGLEENRQDSENLRRLFETVLRQDALTIAMVQGACVAGGCGLATAHDFVLAAENARFMYSEVRIGFVAALVATFLPLRLRGSDIRELLLNPDFVEASRAHEIGLVNRVVPGVDLSTAGESLANEILTRASSESIARTKRCLLEVLGQPLSAALEYAAQANADARLTDDCRRGIATFLETKAPPDWRHG